MTIEEKRERLENYCNDRYDCVSCPLNDKPDIDCCDFFNCSDEVAKKAYNLVFGNCDDCQFYECDVCDLPCRDCIHNYGENDHFEPINSGTVPEEINHPERYAGGKFECIDVMLDVFGADAVKHFCILNAFKYLWRAEKKNGVEDIKKAV